jgi:glycosyltransferase involved in cell wall biosynthesis
MDILGTPEGKITTVHLATSIEPCREDADASWLPRDYLLFVGIRRGHKNFAAMFKCLVPVLKARPTLSLVCVGGGPFDEEEKRMFQESGLSGRVIQISASDEQLPVIYHSAAAYLCPSLYEGFGIPTLEAMKCGCPAVLNHTTSLPEIGGDAARYFNMDDPGSLQPALETVLDDAGLRQEMREQGRRQAANFSWERTKQETIEAYHGVL